MINIRNIVGFALLTTTMLFTSCNKDFDTPPVSELPTGNIITIDSLKNIYTAFDSTITADISVYGIVSADELSGNLYKTIYVQDETDGILLKLTASSDKSFFEGDEVRIALKGTTIARYKNMLELDNVNPDVNLIKQSEGNIITPKVVTIADLALVGIYSPYQGQLIQLNDVEFMCSDYCSTYSDPINQSSQNRYLMDTLGNSIIVRTSGYASFAGTPIQQGKGSFVAVVSQYNTDVQLTIRKLSDLTLTGPRKNACPNCPLYVKNFDDNSLTSGGWTTQYPVPNILWTVATFSSNYYANITNGSSKLVGESWLISPAFDLSSTTTPLFNFETATFSANSALKVMISTNYDGVSLPATATWTDITTVLPFTFSSGSWSWTGSGNFDLSAYKQAGVYIAFKYTGTSASWDSWEVDNFKLIDN